MSATKYHRRLWWSESDERWRWQLSVWSGGRKFNRLIAEDWASTAQEAERAMDRTIHAREALLRASAKQEERQ